MRTGHVLHDGLPVALQAVAAECDASPGQAFRHAQQARCVGVEVAPAPLDEPVGVHQHHIAR
ncbi:hypothetical protein ACFCWG_39715 [Streptomyces sp. NPDC056390]|uniref:hypothetical protein n=1 Tax=Streptomyces sp. NPDC056390 TaxID=3345806 RepID=UPI0035E0AAE0